MSPARQIALRILHRVEEGAWASELLLAHTRDIDSRDAGLAREIVFGCLRFQAQLDFLIARYASRRLDPEIFREIVGRHPKTKRFRVHVRSHFERINARLRHRLQPDRLPDAGSGGIKNSLRLARLFAPRLVALRGIGGAN